MSEDYRSHVVEPPACFGDFLDLGSEACKRCPWLKECEEVYEQEEEKDEK